MVAIFKYFSEEAHARAFIDRGKLLMRLRCSPEM